MSGRTCRICGAKDASIVYTPGPREVEQTVLCDKHLTEYATSRLRVVVEGGEEV